MATIARRRPVPEVSELIPVRSVGAVAVATATMVILTAQSAQPVQPVEPVEPAQTPRAVRSAQPVPAERPADTTTGPADQSLSGLLTRMRGLYRETEAASEAYNGAGERLNAQRATVRRLNARLARTRSAVDAGRAEVGELARRQYRDQAAGLPPAVQMLLAEDPVRALQGGHALQRAVGRQAVAVKRLTSGERRDDALAAQAQRAFAKQGRLAAARKAHRDAARKRLREVERLLASLPPERLAQLRKLEGTESARSQRAFMAGGTLGPGTGARAPSQRGARALTFALAQRGKPYASGAEGPHAYDGSGLTARAWAKAGHGIPRTTRQQWRRLTRVPLSELRPGDLVFYFGGATHVGLYAGQGMVVQARRAGDRVRVSPIAANPVTGAVRPDPAARPLPDYAPPRLSVPGRPAADTAPPATPQPSNGPGT